MKKLITLALAVGIAVIGNVAANAALSTAPAGDLSIYTIDDFTGTISRLDLSTETAEVVCESTVVSTSWITGSAFDSATNTVYWVKNFPNGDASIVTVDLYTCEQSDSPLDINGRGDSTDTAIYGLTWYEGGLVVLYEDDLTSYDRIIGDATLVDGVWEVSPTADFGNEVYYSDIAYNPVTDDLYAIDYDCNVYNLTDSISLVAAYSVAGVSTECPTLKIDDAERIWFTSDNSGVLNSDTLSAPGGDLQYFDNGPLNSDTYCEEFFFGPTVITAPVNNAGGLASTGSENVAPILFGTAGLFFAAAAAFYYRFRARRS